MRGLRFVAGVALVLSASAARAADWPEEEHFWPITPEQRARVDRARAAWVAMPCELSRVLELQDALLDADEDRATLVVTERVLSRCRIARERLAKVLEAAYLAHEALRSYPAAAHDGVTLVGLEPRDPTYPRWMRQAILAIGDPRK